MGEIGGGNLPKIIHDNFEEEMLVAHGCATHDFNLVSESEINKVIDALQRSRRGLVYSAGAGKSGRTTVGSVQVLYQRFGDSVLLVTTRSPYRTEDVDFSIGMTIMAEGHRWFPHVAVVDAHNCMTDLSSPVLLATLTATEYQKAAIDAMEACRTAPQFPFRVGVAHHTLPYSREMGFGDLGIQVLVIEVEGQRTAYVLIDGNNMALGARETLLDEILRIVDDAEIMTTDSHVVNTITGKNPVGMNVPVSGIHTLCHPGAERCDRKPYPGRSCGKYSTVRSYRGVRLEPDLPAGKHGQCHAGICCTPLACHAAPGIPALDHRLHRDGIKNAVSILLFNEMSRFIMHF